MAAVFKHKLEPTGIRTPYNWNVEAYRGLCAILVIMNHGTVHRNMLVDNLDFPAFVYYINSPYLSVLVFFCISGYAIGISNNTQQLRVVDYLKKRLIRLYPTLIIAIALSALAVLSFPVKMIVQNLLFLQNEASYFGLAVPIFINFPIWSLNYEMLYYLLFILICFLRPRTWILVTGMLVLSVLSRSLTPNSQFLSYYLNGFYFWILGLLIAWNGVGKSSGTVNLLSLLFYHLCLTHLGYGAMILNTIGFTSNNNLPVLFFLPFCVMLLCRLAGFENKFLKWNTIFCYVMPAFVFAWLLYHGRIFENARWIMCLIFWVLSLVFYNEQKISAWLIKKLTFAGSISYALYLFHVPVAMLVKQYVHSSYMETPLRYLAWIALTVGLSYIAERKVQPVIKSWLRENETKDLSVLQNQA